MADYVAREWSNGDIVTAVNLNNMEQGITEISQGGGGTSEPFIATDSGSGTLDKTMRECLEAFEQGKMCYIKRANFPSEGDWAVQPISHVSYISSSSNNYSFDYYEASSLDDYPVNNQ